MSYNEEETEQVYQACLEILGGEKAALEPFFIVTNDMIARAVGGYYDVVGWSLYGNKEFFERLKKRMLESKYADSMSEWLWDWLESEVDAIWQEMEKREL